MKPAERPTKQADLYWFPLYADKWLSSEAISGMLPEQEGGYIRLLCIMWRAAKAAGGEPSLPDDDAKLAKMSRLGDRWATLGGDIRAQFRPRDGRLFDKVLSEVWKEQQAKHREATKRAKNAAKKRWKHAPAMPDACPEHAPSMLRESISRESIDSLPSSTAGALAPDGPRPAGPRVFTGPEAMRDVLSRVLPQRGEVQ